MSGISSGGGGADHLNHVELRRQQIGTRSVYFVHLGLLLLTFRIASASQAFYQKAVSSTLSLVATALVSTTTAAAPAAVTSEPKGSASSSSPPPTPLPTRLVDENDNQDAKNTGSSSYLLLCLTDGRIYSLHAWTGEYQSVIETSPLLQSNYFEDETVIDDDDVFTKSNIILPGLDGRLYWRPPMSRKSSSSTTVAEQHANDGDSTSPPLRSLPPLEELPLTVTDLLENPVRSCDPEKNGECGILTAQAETSLLALSSTGRLLWKSKTAGKREDESADAKSAKNPLLLQRKDYWVNNVHAATGNPSWNVSLGTYQALDFEDQEEVPDSEFLLDDDDDDTNNHPPSNRDSKPLRGKELPSVLFANAGKTLTAIDPATDTILWRQDVPATLAAVFGIHQGQWKPVPVIPETSSMYNSDASNAKAIVASPALPMAQYKRQELLPPVLKSRLSDYEQFLWQSQQQLWADNAARQNPKSIGAPTGSSSSSSRGKSESAVEIRRPDPNGRMYECGLFAGDTTTCLNLNADLPLQLPSPATVPITVQAEGLLLSWALVGTILAVLAVALGFMRFWYVHKKHKWVTEATAVATAAAATAASTSAATTSVPQLESETTSNRALVHWDTATSLSSSPKKVGFSGLPMKRSRSLPGTMATDALGAEGVPPQLTSRHDMDVMERNGSHDSAEAATQPPVVAPPSTPVSAEVDYSAMGIGIPLVRYSRYASEFEELQALGKGGFGSVYCCKNTLDRRDYAVKKVSIRCSSVEEFQQQLQRVLREVKILAVLDHPNIVRYYAAWLEIEDKQSQQHLYREGDNTSTYGTLSRRHSFSSSQLLTTDSVSEWDTTGPHNGAREPFRGPHGNGTTAGLYSTGGLDGGDASSLLPRRRSLRHIHGNGSKDDLMIFEDSKEDGRDSSSEYKSRSQSSTRNQPTGLRRDLDDNTATSHDDDVNDGTIEADETKDPMAMAKEDASENPSPVFTRHTLYIQMQLCSQGTVADFLSDHEARRGSSADTAVDIPKALRLFLQIAEATQYVHARGLIHRDLKPSNCFMDDSCSSVKVGDFGLSRESSSDDECDNLVPPVDSAPPGIERRNSQEDHTAGVGTRSYASPEQMKGSDYDSSTDVYSLGIMFFELLYPMHTGMERHICLSNLRSNTFPKDWEQAVGCAFPTVKDLLISMLSSNPTSRPTAVSVARHIQSILGEFTIVSLDQQHYRNRPDTVLLRIEAAHCEDALQQTMQLIRDESTAANEVVDIVQYGLRSGTVNMSIDGTPDKHGANPGSPTHTTTAIMEFALRYNNVDRDGETGTTSESKHDDNRRAVSNLVFKLIQRPEIFKARQVSDPLSFA